MPLAFAPATEDAIPLHVVAADNLDQLLGDMPEADKAWVKAQGFTADLGQYVVLPGADGAIAQVLVGYGTPKKRARGRFHLGGVAAKLPKGTYRIAGGEAARGPFQIVRPVGKGMPVMRLVAHQHAAGIIVHVQPFVEIERQ